jgi:hypothetical protein
MLVNLFSINESLNVYYKRKFVEQIAAICVKNISVMDKLLEKAKMKQ